MDTIKITMMAIIGIVAIAISLIVTQLFLRLAKSKSEKEGKINLAYSVLFSTWLIAFSFPYTSALSILNEYIDTVYKANLVSPLENIIKATVFFIGLTNTWVIIWHFITKVFSVLFVGKRNDINEIECNHFTYFLMRGVVLISFISCLMPVFETILRGFLPNILIPYYR
ncbi:hypothetical protein D9M68_424130 [compost metagenome]